MLRKKVKICVCLLLCLPEIIIDKVETIFTYSVSLYKSFAGLCISIVHSSIDLSPS